MEGLSEAGLDRWELRSNIAVSSIAWARTWDAVLFGPYTAVQYYMGPLVGLIMVLGLQEEDYTGLYMGPNLWDGPLPSVATVVQAPARPTWEDWPISQVCFPGDRGTPSSR